MAINNPFDGIVNLIQGTNSGELFSGKLQAIVDQLAELKAASDSATRSNSVANNTSANGATSVSTSVLETISGFFGGGLGLLPLVGGLAKIFGSGNDLPEPASNLASFVPPSALRVSAGFLDGVAREFAVDTQQGGAVRAVTQPVTATTQITVQVNAMDSKSFLDHSDDIAKAVRQAMLESTVLNDVIRET